MRTGCVLGKLVRTIGFPCFCAVLLQCGAIGRLNAAEYWLGGEDPVVQKDKHKDHPADYMDLFRPNTPWSSGAAGLTAFKISTQLVVRGTDEQLKTVIDGLKARHIGLAVEIGLLVYSDRCGHGTEGYSGPSTIEKVAKRIMSMGGQLDYIAMDEPVTWGHTQSGTNKKGYEYCHESISDLVKDMGPNVAILQRYFPNIRFGDIESINARFPDMPRDVLELSDEFDKQLNVKLAFVHYDVAWVSNWRPLANQLTGGLRKRRVAVGVICDGDEKVGSDPAWTSQALARCTDVARDPKTRPDQFVIQSWEPVPYNMLPETKPGTLTFLLKQVETLLR
jgi:hypothetical protein